MINKYINAWVAVISHKRTENIQKIQEVLGCGVTFYVNKGCGAEYEGAGAERVVECGHDIVSAHNRATIEAWHNKLPSWHISDDLKKITQIKLLDGKRVITPTTFNEVANDIQRAIDMNEAVYGAVAVNSNPLNYTGEDYSFDKLIVNDMFCIWPNADEAIEAALFDPAVALKEDYDMCIRQLVAGRPIIRANKYLCDFPHRQNAGGANTYRNTETEDAATQALYNKWGSLIKKHATRPGQISLNYKEIEQYKRGQTNKLFS
jgi:hypothetical protein